jgi:uncharacterized protein RhaS with RHS repeats
MKTRTLVHAVVAMVWLLTLTEAAAFYDPGAQRWINRDPIGHRGGVNLFTSARNNPVTFIDALGLDVWIEGPAGDEPAGHQSVCVGDPNGDYSAFSFGATGIGSKGLQGTVYEDTEKGGKIDECKYYATTPEVDEIIRSKLDGLILQEEEKRYQYRLANANCRTWSQKQFDLIAEQLEKHKKGKKSAPPERTTKPDPASPGISSSRPTTRSTSEPTTTTACTSEGSTAAQNGE